MAVSYTHLDVYKRQFHEFTSSSEKLELSKQEQQYQYIAADGSTTSFFSFSKYSSDDYFISEGHSASGFYSIHTVSYTHLFSRHLPFRQ